MENGTNYKKWFFIGNLLCLFCTPVGIYTWIQARNLNKMLKIEDYEGADKCVKNIKTGLIIAAIGWGVFIILAALIG